MVLVADAIKDVTNIVLDGFGDSGTALLAAQRTGRIARLIELDLLYCDVICRHYVANTGRPAHLDGTDQAFDDVAIDRANETSPQEAYSPVTPCKITLITAFNKPYTVLCTRR